MKGQSDRSAYPKAGYAYPPSLKARILKAYPLEGQPPAMKSPAFVAFCEDIKRPPKGVLTRWYRWHTEDAGVNVGDRDDRLQKPLPLNGAARSRKKPPAASEAVYVGDGMDRYKAPPAATSGTLESSITSLIAEALARHESAMKNVLSLVRDSLVDLLVMIDDVIGKGE